MVACTLRVYVSTRGIVVQASLPVQEEDIAQLQVSTLPDRAAAPVAASDVPATGFTRGVAWGVIQAICACGRMDVIAALQRHGNNVAAAADWLLSQPM